MPSVIGQSRDDAVSTLINAGLSPHSFAVHSSKPIDTVVAQDPTAGKVVEKGSTVRINYSSGPAAVTVPSVIGMTFDQASTTLRNQGFQVSRTDVDSDQAKGIVVDQSPSGSATPGSTIQLSVSKGPKQSTVPDVTSQDEASARTTLEQRRLHGDGHAPERDRPGSRRNRAQPEPHAAGRRRRRARR